MRLPKIFLWYISIYLNISKYIISYDIFEEKIYHDISILYFLLQFRYIVIYHFIWYIDISLKISMLFGKYFTIYRKYEISRYIISWYIAIYRKIYSNILIYRDISAKYRRFSRYLLACVEPLLLIEKGHKKYFRGRK